MSNNKILCNTGTVDLSIQDISKEVDKLINDEETKLKLTPENADSGLAKTCVNTG